MNSMVQLLEYVCTIAIKQAQELDAAGKKQEAEMAAKRARNLNIIGLIAGTISAIIFIILMFIIIIVVASS